VFSEWTRRAVQTLADDYCADQITRDAGVVALRETVKPHDFPRAFDFLPPDLVVAVREDLVRRPPPREVGYWWSPEEPDLPDPRRLAVAHRQPRLRDQIVAYLRAGETYEQWRGYSWCRFQCGADGPDMGSCCLTDGEWVWPQGLAHYVQHHDIALPGPFIETMRANNWNADAKAKSPAVDGWSPVPSWDYRRKDLGFADRSFWLKWPPKQSRVGLLHQFPNC
jgi:hypothetical protein